MIGEQPEESLNNPTSEVEVVGTLSSPTETNGKEEKVLASLGSLTHIDSTLEGQQSPAEETLAARGLEEQRNFKELLTESVGRVHFS
jgi:hypothetical protein